MTEEGIDVVLAEAVVPGKELLVGIVDITCMILTYDTVGSCILTIVGVGHGCLTHFLQVDAVVGSELEVLEEAHLNKATTGKGISFNLVGVENGGIKSVGVTKDRTLQAGVVARAVVEACVADFIDHDVAGAVADIKRIDGSDLSSSCEDVACGVGGAFFIVHGIHHDVAVTAAGPNLKPGLGLYVGTQAGGETLEIALGDNDTVVFQIADRSEEVALVVTLGNAYIVFLTEAVLVGFVKPVVWLKEIACALIVDVAAKSRTGVQAAVLTDKILTLGNGIDIVAETIGVIGTHILIGPNIGFLRLVAKTTDVFLLTAGSLDPLLVGAGKVVKCTVVCFVILGGILDKIVILCGAGIEAPLGVDRNLGFAEFGTLGCDEDHTVGTAGTVKSIRCSVLEDGHRLDIVGVESIDVSSIRSSVDDYER